MRVRMYTKCTRHPISKKIPTFTRSLFHVRDELSCYTHYASCLIHKVILPYMTLPVHVGV